MNKWLDEVEIDFKEINKYRNKLSKYILEMYRDG